MRVNSEVILVKKGDRGGCFGSNAKCQFDAASTAAVALFLLPEKPRRPYSQANESTQQCSETNGHLAFDWESFLRDRAGISTL
jgi:hypothetical protein